jgi:hypothetical protein
MDDDEKVIGMIKESLDFLDSSVEVKIPDLTQFRQLVSKVEERKTAGKNLQFIIFIVTAVIIICLETYSFSRSTVIFTIVQAIAIASIIPFIITLLIKKRRQVAKP